jgi:hypothetical protein
LMVSKELHAPSEVLMCEAFRSSLCLYSAECLEG